MSNIHIIVRFTDKEGKYTHKEDKFTEIGQIYKYGCPIHKKVRKA